jgi:hypothetical protein
MGRTACTEPQCLYKGALYLYLTVELYLCSLYGPYDLYRASVLIQGCTLPYATATSSHIVRSLSHSFLLLESVYSDPLTASLSESYGDLNMATAKIISSVACSVRSYVYCAIGLLAFVCE